MMGRDSMAVEYHMPSKEIEATKQASVPTTIPGPYAQKAAEPVAEEDTSILYMGLAAAAVLFAVSLLLDRRQKTL